MNRRVLITGGNSGIGLALVHSFLLKGDRVYAHYHDSDKALLKMKCDSLQTFQADLSRIDQARKLFDECCKDGAPDVLINNAAFFSIASEIEDICEDDFDYIIRLNMKAPFILSQLAMAEMKKKKWGRIINISSVGVKYGGNPGSAPYTISKAGLETMTLCFSKAGAGEGVLVNAVRVGVTDTKFHDLNPNKDFARRVSMIPVGRCASPSEIAETILFLASDQSSFTTGIILTVAGGE